MQIKLDKVFYQSGYEKVLGTSIMENLNCIIIVTNVPIYTQFGVRPVEKMTVTSGKYNPASDLRPFFSMCPNTECRSFQPIDDFVRCVPISYVDFYGFYNVTFKNLAGTALFHPDMRFNSGYVAPSIVCDYISRTHMETYVIPSNIVDSICRA